MISGGLLNHYVITVYKEEVSGFGQFIFSGSSLQSSHHSLNSWQKKEKDSTFLWQIEDFMTKQRPKCALGYAEINSAQISQVLIWSPRPHAM